MTGLIGKSKKWLSVVLIFSILFPLLPAGVFASPADNQEKAVTESVESLEKTVVFTIDQKNFMKGDQEVPADAAPYIKDGRTMVPVAFVSQALGTEPAQWLPTDQTVMIKRGKDRITIKIGSKELLINGKKLTMDVAAEIKDIGGGGGRTMLPIAFIARALEVGYEWKAETRQVYFYGYTRTYDLPGTFGPDIGGETINGSVVIKSPDVKLQNMIIKGNLTIAEEVGKGAVTLNNITVKGETFIRGGGKDSIYINGGDYKNITVQNVDGQVRIVATDVNGLTVVIAEDAVGEEIILEGNFDNVVLESENITLTTQGNTTIGEIIVGQNGNGATINLSSSTTVEKMVLESKTEVKGTGTIKEAEVKADDVKFEKEPENTTLADNVTTQPTTPSGSSGNDDSGYIAPLERVKQLIQQNKTLGEIAKIIKDEYKYDATQITKLLYDMQFSSKEVAQGLVQAGFEVIDILDAIIEICSGQIDITLEVLIYAGIEAKEIFNAIVAKFEICMLIMYNINDVIKVLKAAGQGIPEIVGLLRSINIKERFILITILDNFGPLEILANMDTLLDMFAGAQPEETLHALGLLYEKAENNEEYRAIVDFLLKATLKMDLKILEIIDWLQSIDVNPIDILQAIMDNFVLKVIVQNLSDIVNRLVGTGISQKDILDAIMDHFDIGDIVNELSGIASGLAQLTAKDILYSLIDHFNATEITQHLGGIVSKLKAAGIGTIIDKLKDAGVNVTAILNAIVANLTSNEIIQNLGDIVSDLKATGESIPEIIELLRGMNIDAGEILQAILDNFNLETIINNLAAIASKLTGLDVGTILQAMIDKFGVVDIAKQLGKIVSWLKNTGSKTAAEIFEMLYNNFDIGDVLSAISSAELSISINDIVNILKGAGNSIGQIIDKLVGQFSAGEILQAILDNFNLDDIVNNLAAIASKLTGLDVGTILQAMIDKFGIVDIAKQLGKIVSWLKNTGSKTAAEIFEMLYNNFDIGDVLSAISSAELSISVSEIVSTLKGAGNSIGQIIDKLVGQFSAGEILQAILDNFNLDDIVNNLAAIASKLTGLDVGTILQAMIDKFGVVDIAKQLGKIVSWLKNTGSKTAAEIFEMLYNNFNIGDILSAINSAGLNISVSEIVSTLKGAGKTIGQIIDMLLNNFNADAILSEILDNFNASEITQNLGAIISKLKAAGIGALIDALKNAVQATDLLDAIMKNFSLDDIISSLDYITSNLTGVTATNVMQAIVNNFNLNDIYPKLVTIVSKLKTAFSLTVDGVAGLLKVAGCDAANAAMLLFDPWGYNATQIAGALKNIFASGVNDIAYYLYSYCNVKNFAALATTLKNVFAQLPTSDIVKALKERCSASAMDIANVLVSVFSQGATGAAEILKQIGFSPADIVDVLASVFGVTVPEEVAEILKDAGFTAEQLAAVLIALVGNSYEQLSHLIFDIWGDMGEVAKVLLALDPNLVAATAAIWLKNFAFNVNQIAQALKYGLGLLDKDIVSTLNQYLYYNVQVIAQALKDGLSLSVETIAKALKDSLKFTPEEVGKAIVDVFSNITEDALRATLSWAGYGIDTINDVVNWLKNILEWIFPFGITMTKTPGNFNMEEPVTLESIEVTTPPDKTVYKVGEELDLTGLVVTGTYSDGSAEPLTITIDNISGFDSSAAAEDHVITMTVEGKTATFTVDIITVEFAEVDDSDDSDDGNNSNNSEDSDGSDENDESDEVKDSDETAIDTE